MRPSVLQKTELVPFLSRSRIDTEKTTEDNELLIRPRLDNSSQNLLISRQGQYRSELGLGRNGGSLRSG